MEGEIIASCSGWKDATPKLKGERKMERGRGVEKGSRSKKGPICVARNAMDPGVVTNSWKKQENLQDINFQKNT